MKSVIDHFKKYGDKYFVGIHVAAILAIFLYLFIENFVLSEGWEVLALRSIDDFAMQDSLRNMQHAMLHGHTKRVLTFFDYGYGNLFWLVNAILFLPLYWLDFPQLQIVLGRQISLAFIFGSIFLVGRIAERLRTDVRYLKYTVMLLLAVAPMNEIIGTKFHVNAQSLFFGVLAYYMLIRHEVPSQKDIKLSALFAGVATGLKLTGMFVIPVLGLTLIGRSLSSPKAVNGKQVLLFGGIAGLVGAVTALPALALFPLFSGPLKETYKTFLTYKGMGGSVHMDAYDFYTQSISYFLPPWLFAVILAMWGLLLLADWRKRRTDSGALFTGMVLVVGYICVTVDKAPVYVSTYASCVAFFYPLGVLGLGGVRLSDATRRWIGLGVVFLSVCTLQGFRHVALPYHRFFEMARNHRVVEQLQALEGMKKALGPIKPPLRVLQDATAVFPATRFINGVDVVYCYGNLRTLSGYVGGFDYIVLNTREYIGKMDLDATPANAGPMQALDVARVEEGIRQQLRADGTFFGRRYKLIYEGHDAVLYGRIPE